MRILKILLLSKNKIPVNLKLSSGTQNTSLWSVASSTELHLNNIKKKSSIYESKTTLTRILRQGKESQTGMETFHHSLIPSNYLPSCMCQATWWVLGIYQWAEQTVEPM
jgi:hypothetical protein